MVVPDSPGSAYPGQKALCCAFAPNVRRPLTQPEMIVFSMNRMDQLGSRTLSCERR